MRPRACCELMLAAERGNHVLCPQMRPVFFSVYLHLRSISRQCVHCNPMTVFAARLLSRSQLFFHCWHMVRVGGVAYCISQVQFCIPLCFIVILARRWRSVSRGGKYFCRFLVHEGPQHHGIRRGEKLHGKGNGNLAAETGLPGCTIVLQFLQFLQQ
jgi:hypothetical protein